jgi:hypothetical protein
MAEHDASYRLLFSHRALVADLLRGFLPAAWVEALDLTSLERLNASFVSEQLVRREGDVIWRIRWGPNWLYVVILLEFQSSDEPYMAVRIGAYALLLYQALIEAGALARGEKLPPLLPLVLYNGKRRWTGVTELAALIETPPAGLEAYQPQVRYVLIDETRYSDVELDQRERNIAAALFRLERSPTIETLAAVVGALKTWLAAPAQTSLRRALAVWVRRVLLPLRLPGVDIPEVNDLDELDAIIGRQTCCWVWFIAKLLSGNGPRPVTTLQRVALDAY